jgi:hypothetical protein
MLVPPLSVAAIFQWTLQVSENQLERMVSSALTTLLLLWFKGATAAFYLRRTDVDDCGSAFEDDSSYQKVPRVRRWTAS